MYIYDLHNNDTVSEKKKGWFNKEEDFFIVCNPNEMNYFDDIFKFDPYTIQECINLDENIRFESYNGYDFISIIYFYLEDKQMLFSEINLYIGKNYIIFVMPIDEKIAENFMNFFQNFINSYEAEGLISLYHKILHKVVTDLFNALEEYEDIISDMELKILEEANSKQLNEIIFIKSTANRIKKLLRAFIYVGDNFAINENNFISLDKMKFFSNIDSRMNKLYGFAETVNDRAMQLIHLYDSKIGMQTNEVVTKLTLLTVFVGPLTVITGVYGMNFVHMPELTFIYGYPIVIIFMIVFSFLLYIYLKKSKKWM